MSEPSVVELKLSADGRAGRYRASMLLMPLRSDFGEINRVLGLHLRPGELFAPPLAFRIDDVSVSPIEPRANAEPARALPGFAEEQRPSRPRPRARSCGRSRAIPTLLQAARRDAEVPGDRQLLNARERGRGMRPEP
jgi:hypothetical protein